MEAKKTYCAGCIFNCDYTGTCDYILITGQRRPCPGGDGCTERITRKEASMARANWDTAKAHELFLAGKSDKEIGEALNVPAASVGFYRRKHWGGTRPAPVKKKEVEGVSKIKTESDQQAPMDLYSVMEAATGELKGIQAICTANAIQSLWNWKSIQDLERARASIDHLIKRLGEENAAQ